MRFLAAHGYRVAFLQIFQRWWGVRFLGAHWFVPSRATTVRAWGLERTRHSPSDYGWRLVRYLFILNGLNDLAINSLTTSLFRQDPELAGLCMRI